MAISNYEELKKAITAWLNRGDLDEHIPEFIAIAEAKINRKLRVRQQRKVSQYSISTEQALVPPDFLQVAQISLDGPDGGEIEYVTPQLFTRQRAGADSGPTGYYTLDGEYLRFLPVPGSGDTIYVTYYARVPALSDAAPTNWLLEEAEDLYLAASLMAANTFLRDVEGVTLATAEMADILASMHTANEIDKTSTTPVMRSEAI